MNMNTDNRTIDGNGNNLSKAQREKLKKFAVFVLMGLIFVGCMYLIFSPSADDRAKQEQSAGLNAELPMPKDESIIGDKRDAYEQEQMKQKQEERMRSLADFSSLLGDNSQKNGNDDDLSLITDEPAAGKKTGSSRTYKNGTQSSVHSSAQTYRDINRTLGSFYESPREDPEKERLKQELEDMKTRIDETETPKMTMDNQLELMEKSFQMAAKYMPQAMGTAGTVGTSGTSATANTGNTAEPASTANKNASGKTATVSVVQVQERTVSALLPEMSDAAFIETYSKPRNMSFLSPAGVVDAAVKNTVSACIAGEQTVMDRQNVRLRLLEPIQAGNIVIPRNTLLIGTAKIQNERLGITVGSLEHAGMIIPVELRVYDLDGQQGIFIPNMQELSAAKEIVANMGTSAGTSITLSDDAGKQFAADMGRNLIQGVSQFTAKKLREVKVHLKDGYKIFLITE
jgi:conjugative transposon TraM protein